MATEDASYISELNAAYPADGDAVGEGGGTTTGTGSTRGHLNMIKYALKTQFSGLSGTTAVTASEAEMNYLDIATLGTSEASKVVTADANGDVTIADGAYDFDVASHDGTNGLLLGGTLVTASATEVNLLDGKSVVGDAVLATDQSWTGSQRATYVTDNDGSYDLDAGQNFVTTPSGTTTITFTTGGSDMSSASSNGQSGFIKLINSGGETISLGTAANGADGMGTTLSTTGTYLLSYFSDGTNVWLTNSAIYA